MTKLTFTEKLIKVQSELRAPKSNYNSFGKFSYRSAEDILEAVKPLNAEYGLLLTLRDEPVISGDRHYIKATAVITDGEGGHEVTAYAREMETKRGMDESQITGTASSYARKYALNGLYLIDDTKDADTDAFQQQTRSGNDNRNQGNQNNGLNQELIGTFAKALDKVGGHDELYKAIDMNKSAMTKLTNSNDDKKKREVIEKLEGIVNGAE